MAARDAEVKISELIGAAAIVDQASSRAKSLAVGVSDGAANAAGTACDATKVMTTALFARGRKARGGESDPPPDGDGPQV